MLLSPYHRVIERIVRVQELSGKRRGGGAFRIDLFDPVSVVGPLATLSAASSRWGRRHLCFWFRFPISVRPADEIAAPPHRYVVDMVRFINKSVDCGIDSGISSENIIGLGSGRYRRNPTVRENMHTRRVYGWQYNIDWFFFYFCGFFFGSRRRLLATGWFVGTVKDTENRLSAPVTGLWWWCWWLFYVVPVITRRRSTICARRFALISPVPFVRSSFRWFSHGYDGTERGRRWEMLNMLKLSHSLAHCLSASGEWVVVNTPVQ